MVCIDDSEAPADGARMPASPAAAEGGADEFWDGPGLGEGGEWELGGAASPAARPPRSPLPAGQQQQQQAVGQHRLLFSESGAALRWDAAGRLAIAPPPTLEALLAAAAGSVDADLAERQSGEPAGADVPAGGVPTPQPSQQQPALAPLLAPDGLVLQLQPPAEAGAGDDAAPGAAQRHLVHFRDPTAHRWAFLAAAGAQTEAEAEAERQQRLQAGRQQASGPAAGDQAKAAPAAAAAAPAGKPAKASKPRKRKPAPGAAAGAAAAGAEAGVVAAAAAKPKRRKVCGVVGWLHNAIYGMSQLCSCVLCCQHLSCFRCCRMPRPPLRQSRPLLKRQCQQRQPSQALWHPCSSRQRRNRQHRSRLPHCLPSLPQWPRACRRGRRWLPLGTLPPPSALPWRRLSWQAWMS